MRNPIVALGLVATMLLAASCTEGPPPRSEAATGPPLYDPANDPLVNPPELFETLPEDNPELAARDETLIRTLGANPNTLNPIFGSSIYDSYVAGLLFDGLFSIDRDMNWFVDDHVVEHIEDSEDHLVTTVRLRPGLKWHDGQPVTAHDVRFSWEAILDERVPALSQKPGTDQIADVRVLDDLSFEFIHKEALATNPWNMMFSIIPKHIYDHPEEREKDPSLNQSIYYTRHNRTDVIGWGPYRFVEWVANDRIVVERWDDYHGEKPHFRRIIFKIQPDQNVSLLLFKKGDLDEMRVSAQQFAEETNDPDFQRHGVKGFGTDWGYSYIGWNMDGSNPFFTDPLVRRALAHAINIPHLIETIGYNMFTPCHGIFHPESWTFHPGVELIPYDLQAAAALLDEAGWRVSETDGWRYKEIDGRPVKFEFTLMLPQESPTSPRVAAIFEQDLRKIGVSMKQRVLEWATFSQMIHKHEFQAQIAGWGAGSDPDTNWNLWRSDQYQSGRNFGGYSNARVDELFQLGRREFDREKRADIYREIQKIIYDDQPCIFLWNSATTWVFHKRLRGIGFSPRGVFGFYPGMGSWWVPAGMQMR